MVDIFLNVLVLVTVKAIFENKVIIFKVIHSQHRKGKKNRTKYKATELTKPVFSHPFLFGFYIRKCFSANLQVSCLAC